MPTGDDRGFSVLSLGSYDTRKVSLHCQQPAAFPVMRCEEEQKEPDVEVCPTFQFVRITAPSKNLSRPRPISFRFLKITTQGSGFCQ